MDILVDSNVILDIATEDKNWFRWSSETLANYAETHILVINPIIYAEVSIGFDRIEDVALVLPVSFFRRDSIPWEAPFLAGKCFVACRRRGGEKSSTLPDFLSEPMPPSLKSHCSPGMPPVIKPISQNSN